MPSAEAASKTKPPSGRWTALLGGIAGQGKSGPVIIVQPSRRLCEIVHKRLHHSSSFSPPQFTARRSGPFVLVMYRWCSFDRKALWDFCHPCPEPGSAGPVSDRHPGVDRASGPVRGSAGRRDGSGSSYHFLSWEHHTNGSKSVSFL
jgi:hypothetical protein